MSIRKDQRSITFPLHSKLKSRMEEIKLQVKNLSLFNGNENRKSIINMAIINIGNVGILQREVFHKNHPHPPKKINGNGTEATAHRDPVIHNMIKTKFQPQ